MQHHWIVKKKNIHTNANNSIPVEAPVSNPCLSNIIDEIILYIVCLNSE